jgi:enamine deaminase RidA (YjgF/YER057c/UK114 family)
VVATGEGVGPARGHVVGSESSRTTAEGRRNAADGDQSVAVVATGGGYNQAEAVSGHTTHLYCAGQTAIDADGKPQFAGDLGAQLGLALDNLQAVLDAAGMTLGDVVRLNIFTTDVDAFLAQLGVMHARLHGAAPPGTLLGVARLAYPELMVEIEATAVA